ncbi:MAG: flagellar hook-basal body complex protein FliE [Gaiellaceae bacterium]
MPTPISGISPVGLGGLAGPTAPTPATGGGGFGSALTQSIDKLDALQQNADAGAQALATGKATDVASVAMDVERASLALQLASQVRTKLVDAYQEIFRMQV